MSRASFVAARRRADRSGTFVSGRAIALLALSIGTLTVATASAQTCQFSTCGDTMTLLDDCVTDATITIPDGLTLDGQHHTITAVDPAGGHFLGAVVTNGGDTAVVRDLRIVGKFTSTTCDENNLLRGILFLNTTRAEAHDTFIEGMHRGPGNTCQDGNGIVAERMPYDGTHPATGEVKIAHNVLVDFQRLGVYVAGDLNAEVRENSLATSIPAPAGGSFIISMFDGATGRIDRNDINGGYTSGEQNVNGIVGSDVTDVHVVGNRVDGCNYGMGLQALCQYTTTPPTTGNELRGNDIRGAVTIGILVIPQAISATVCTPEVNDNTIANNLVSGSPAGVDGVAIAPSSNGFPFSPSANRNAVVGNVIAGYTTPILDEGTDTIVKDNDIVP